MNNITNQKCYICKDGSMEIIRNNLRNDIKRDVLKCNNCGVAYLKEENKDLRKFYEKEYRETHSHILNKGISSKDLFDTNLPLQKFRFDKISQYINKDSNVLEIGSSAGHFLYSIKDEVKKCTGIELNIDNAKFANEELCIKTYTTPIEETDLEESSFDIIFSFHTLEHIDNPRETINNWKKYLKPNGTIYIRVPNVNDSLMSIFKIDEYADFWWREAHFFNYSDKSLKLLMEECGFKGEIRYIQEYNVLNQLNWILTKKPQPTCQQGMNNPYLINGENLNKENNIFNDMILNLNENYIKELENQKATDTIEFIGSFK